MRSERIKSFILSALAVCITIPSITCSAAVQRGDYDANGIIDGNDATAILTHYAKTSSGKEPDVSADIKKAADADMNGNIDGRDASTVLSYYAMASVGYKENLEFYVNNEAIALDPFGSGLESEIEADSLLAGKWDILAKGDPNDTPDFSAVFSYYDEREFSIYMNNMGIYGKGDYETSNYFDTPRGCYNLLRNTTEMNVKLNPNGPEMPFGGMIDTHFTAASVDGAYVMAIRVIGNGISIFDQILGDERQAADGVWLLRKNSNEVYHVIDDIEMDTLREKNKTFYAYRWLDKGSEVYLQTVTAANTKTVLDDGIEHDAMFFSYANNGHALTAVRYNVKDAKEKADPGTYKPALVKVRTDSSGNVTELEEVPKYDYGYYHVF